LKGHFVLYSIHQQFEQASKQITAIHAGKGFPSFSSCKQQANNQQTKISSQLRGSHTLVCSFGGFLRVNNQNIDVLTTIMSQMQH
jgi:hypothetical protein